MTSTIQLQLSPAHAEQAARPVLVGYSGGLDSSVLLHRLAAEPAVRTHGLRAIHVHHRLHRDADGWARHCGRTCAALGIALDVVEVEVRHGEDIGLEAAARNARHAAFESALRDDEVLALAHHLDDQAETFLLRALRGSGDGLGAMAPWRAYGRGWLWRPLLGTPRDELQTYARAHDLGWIEDPSNADDRHDRNFLRLGVMPLLRQRWPAAAASLAHCAALQRDARELLGDDDARALASLRGIDPTTLDARKLGSLPRARRARVLRRWIAESRLPPLPAEGAARIQRDLLPDDAGDGAAFAWRDAVVRRWRDLLWAERRRPALPADYTARWNGRTPLLLPTGDHLGLLAGADEATAADQGPYVVHARIGGERIRLPGRPHSHALKHVLQDLGVPPWVRARLPLLSSAAGTLLAAGDLVYSAGFDARLRAIGQRLVWASPTPT